MRIDRIFPVENFDDPRKIDWLKQEAGFFLKIMETRTGDVPAERSASTVSPDELELFFRRKERSDMVCQTLQYLLAFLAHIPGAADISGEPVDPTEQFREFVRYQADLLLEEDVKNAVFQETTRRNHLQGGNVWDAQERVLAMSNELRELAAKEEDDAAGTICNLCRGLEQLCLFWFEIRQRDIRRARRSDIYLYLLARLVQHRSRRRQDS